MRRSTAWSSAWATSLHSLSDISLAMRAEAATGPQHLGRQAAARCSAAPTFACRGAELEAKRSPTGRARQSSSRDTFIVAAIRVEAGHGCPGVADARHDARPAALNPTSCREHLNGAAWSRLWPT